jgi:hypothetical protein
MARRYRGAGDCMNDGVYVTQMIKCCKTCVHWEPSFTPWTPGAHYCDYLTGEAAESLVYTAPTFACCEWAAR